jgi:PAS domain-containing protein
MISPLERRVTLTLDRPFAVYSRQVLNSLVLDRAIDSTRSSSGMLLVRGENEDVPRLVARRGDARLKTSELMRLHIVSQAFVNGQPVVERDLKQTNGVVARLSVPLVRDYDVLGVITLESQTPNAYGAEEVEFVSQLANLATIAIDNARVFEWVQDSRNRLQVILDSMNEAVILFDPDGKAVLNAVSKDSWAYSGRFSRCKNCVWSSSTRYYQKHVPFQG